MGRRRCGTRPADRELLTLKGHTGRVNSVCLVAGRDAAGDGESGWHGEGVGRGRRTRAAHPQGPYGPGLFRVPGRRTGRGWRRGVEDSTAKVWDAAGGRELLTLKGHTGLVYAVCWSPDGTRLATGSYDGTAKVWDAAGGPERLTLKGHTGRGPFRVLVAGRDAAGDGECGWDGEGVGRGRRPRTAHPQGPSGRGPVRVLVAGRDAAGDGE